MTAISFVILTYRREGLLRACLESLERAGAGQLAEAWIGFNGDEEASRSLRAELAERFPWAHPVALERTGRSEARNALIPRASSDIVYFLDDDAFVPPGFIARAIDAFARHPEAAVVGGPNVAPPGSPPFERAVDCLLRSPLGAGPMRVRYRPDGEERRAPGWCFMLSNFGARRSVFEKHRLFFPARCASAEENLFLYQVERRAGPAVLSPGLYVFHHRRPTASSFSSQVFTNGRGRGQITCAAPGSLQAAVLAPPLLVLCLVAAPLLGRWALLPIAAYGLACVAAGVWTALSERDLQAAWRLPLLFPLAHLSYACGLLAGLFFSGKEIHADIAVEYPRRARPADV